MSNLTAFLVLVAVLAACACLMGLGFIVNRGPGHDRLAGRSRKPTLPSNRS